MKSTIVVFAAIFLFAVGIIGGIWLTTDAFPGASYRKAQSDFKSAIQLEKTLQASSEEANTYSYKFGYVGRWVEESPGRWRINTRQWNGYDHYYPTIPFEIPSGYRVEFFDTSCDDPDADNPGLYGPVNLYSQYSELTIIRVKPGETSCPTDSVWARLHPEATP